MPGSLPKTALLVIDMINAYDFEDAEKLLESAREAVPGIAGLVRRARDDDVEVIYVNDNFGRWNSAGQVTERCILYSALDAYIRQLEVAVPRDAVAHIHEGPASAALRMMEVNMRADVCGSEDRRLRQMI